MGMCLLLIIAAVHTAERSQPCAQCTRSTTTTTVVREAQWPAPIAHLETHTGNISHGVTTTTKSGNQHLILQAKRQAGKACQHCHSLIPP